MCEGGLAGSAAECGRVENETAGEQLTLCDSGLAAGGSACDPDDVCLRALAVCSCVKSESGELRCRVEPTTTMLEHELPLPYHGVRLDSNHEHSNMYFRAGECSPCVRVDDVLCESALASGRTGQADHLTARHDA